MPKVINYTLECINSHVDEWGNRHYAFTYTDHNTGKEVHGTVGGGESNVRSIAYTLNGGNWEQHDYLFTVTELPIRQYNRLVKGWEYAGCAGDQLVAFIRQHLTPEVTE